MSELCLADVVSYFAADWDACDALGCLEQYLPDVVCYVPADWGVQDRLVGQWHRSC